MSLENIATQTQEKTEDKGKSKIKRLAKNIGKKLAVASLTTALTLGTAELIFRQYEKHSTSVLFMDDKVQTSLLNLERSKYNPNEIVFESKCNSQGYYDEQEFTIAKKPNVNRVIAISDSFGCVRVPIKYHAFTKAENLEEKFGNPKWEIYNMSINGTNPETYLYILRENTLQYNSNLIIIGFCCGNDLEINDPLGFYNRDKSRLKNKEPPSEKIKLIKAAKRLYKIYKAGYLFGEKEKRIISKHESDLKKITNIHSEEWWMNINNESSPFPDNIYLIQEIKNFNRNMFSTEYPNYVRLKEIFTEMKELTNNKLTVVLFPMAYQVDDTIYNKIISSKESNYIKQALKSKYVKIKEIENVDRDRVYKNVRDILKEQNISVIELLEPLKQGQKEHERVYYLNDTHLNFWGNHIAAREIRKYIGSYFEAEKEK